MEDLIFLLCRYIFPDKKKDGKDGGAAHGGTNSCTNIVLDLIASLLH